MSSDKNIDQIKKLLEYTTENLQKVSALLEKVEFESNKSQYEDLPGVTGLFDGAFLVDENNTKYEVPANYAAKSRLIFGDKLKLVEIDGNKMFKQIEKLARKKLEGVASKKEGKWYAITDSGTYKISDVAADFNKLEINDKVVVLIPEGTANVPYAAFDKVLNKDTQTARTQVVEVSKPAPVQVEKKPEVATKPKQVKKPMPNKPKNPGPKREYVQDIATAKPAPKVEKAPEIQRAQPAQPAHPAHTAQPTPPSSVNSGLLEDDDLR